MKLNRIQSLIHQGETVYQFFSRINREGPRACRWMPEKVYRDSRPATPRRILAAVHHLKGYGGALVREVVTGEWPGGVHGPADIQSLRILIGKKQS